MDKKVVVSKVITKLSGSRIEGDEVDLDNLPEKFKQKHGFGKEIDSAYINEIENYVIILCEGVFVPYTTGVKIISVTPHDEDLVKVTFGATSAEIKEILKKEDKDE